MNIFLLLFLLVVSIVMMAYGLTHLNPNKKSDKSNVLPKSDDTSEQQNEPAQQEQPTHFDLFDDNGEPIPSSSDSSRPSKSISPSVRMVVSPGDDKEPKVRRLRYFCIKDKGYHVSVCPKDQYIPDYVEFQIAGITHGEHIDDHLGEFVATLEPEPTNPYDSNAIKIVTSEGHRVGYVPKDQTADVRNFTTLPCRCYCYIGTNDGLYFSDCYITRKDQ